MSEATYLLSLHLSKIEIEILIMTLEILSLGKQYFFFFASCWWEYVYPQIDYIWMLYILGQCVLICSPQTKDTALHG